MPEHLFRVLVEMRFLGGLLALLLCLLTVSSQLPPQDILSLLAFKKGITQDPTGYISESWNEESIDFNGCPSSWNGVVCNGENVAGVVLDGLGVSGSVDLSVFGNLSMLVKLSIAGNNLSGNLPENLGSFKSLKYLDISCNAFSGKIPTDIGRLRSIQNLSFAGNNFSGPLPDSIGDVCSLRSLDLSHNHLSGALPSSLKGLSSLVSLNLSFNEFEKGIPTGLGLISTLESIDLSWNRLGGDVDWEFLTQSGVVNVDFSGNLLTSSNSNEMKFLSQVSDSVKYLNLSHNRLTGSLIDGGELSTFGSLRALDLSYNKLSGPLPSFDYVYDLEIFRLENNDFSGFLSNGLLKDDTLVLTELDLSSNNLSGHVGLITSTTLRILNLYAMEPNVKHYGCMVDMLGRAGRLKVAFELVEEMKSVCGLEPNAVIWRALLGACRTHGNVELAERANFELLKVSRDECASGNYVLLSNIYASTGEWDGAEKMRALMDGAGVMKAGCALLVENGRGKYLNKN